MKNASSTVMHFGFTTAIAATAMCMVGAGCSSPGGAGFEPVADTTRTMTFEEFESKVFVDQEGVYVVDGDTPIVGRKLLEEFYEAVYTPNQLIVHRSGTTDAVWTATQKLNLTYCVSDTFGSRKAQVVQAMADATAAWSAAANVKYVYVPAQDATCTASNANVVFDVRPTSGQSYLARSFFPNQGRSTRNVIIDSSSYSAGSWTLVGILRHELGHTLGFRHEHTRPEAGTCFEDNSWRALTTYDQASVMHYPQCNGVDNGLVLTAKDKQGAQSIYGAPGGGGGGGSDGGTTPPPPPPGNDQTFTKSASVARGVMNQYGPLAATSHVKAVITGTGDADLYVRFGSAPTTTTFACRPYLDTSSEVCELDVPAGQTNVYVGVRGYTAASYTLTVTYR